jgi:hypothetical protein
MNVAKTPIFMLALLVLVGLTMMRGGLTRDALAGMHYVFPTLTGSVFDAMSD